MQNKKIMLVIPFLALAGAEIMVVDLAKGLKEAGNEVIVISLYTYESCLTQELKGLDISVQYLGKKPGIDIGIFMKMFNLIKKEKPDVVHTNLNVVKYVMPAAIFYHVKSRVHTVHSIASKEQEKFDRIITKFFAKHFGLELVGISPKIKDSICEEYKIDKNLIPMIFNGRDLTTFLPKKNYNVGTKTKILHIGRFSFEKNHELLLKAFKQAVEKNDNLELYLIGEGDLFESMKQFVSDLRITDKVFFLGLKEDIGSIMQTMDIFVLPSRYEGMPITLIEAMACGMPIIATNVGGIPDMLNKTNSILIENDAKQLNRAILKLSASQDLRKRLGNNAVEASKRFSYKNMVAEYLKIYKEKQ